MQEEPAEKLLSPAFFAPFTEKVKGKVLYCSFSGGADSLALLLILSYWRNIVPFQLKAVHFEHGFRGMESLKDAEFCRKKCEEKNIPFQPGWTCRYKQKGASRALLILTVILNGFMITPPASARSPSRKTRGCSRSRSCACQAHAPPEVLSRNRRKDQ